MVAVQPLHNLEDIRWLTRIRFKEYGLGLEETFGFEAFERFVHTHLITLLEMLQVPGFLEIRALRNLTNIRNYHEMDSWKSPTINHSKMAYRRLVSQREHELLYVA